MQLKIVFFMPFYNIIRYYFSVVRQKYSFPNGKMANSSDANGILPFLTPYKPPLKYFSTLPLLCFNNELILLDNQYDEALFVSYWVVPEKLTKKNLNYIISSTVTHLLNRGHFSLILGNPIASAKISP